MCLLLFSEPNFTNISHVTVVLYMFSGSNPNKLKNIVFFAFLVQIIIIKNKKNALNQDIFSDDDSNYVSNGIPSFPPPGKKVLTTHS